MGVSLSTVVVIVLLTFGVGVELACCLGVLVMEDAHDKLHYVGPGAIFGPLAVAAAIVVRESLSQAGIKALLTAALLIVVNPVLTHAIGRALYIRRRDHLEPSPRARSLRP
jgi:monovalent cation/proton antiporter MnhG/PhaG subunit